MCIFFTLRQPQSVIVKKNDWFWTTPIYLKRGMRNCQLRSYHKDEFIELRSNTKGYTETNFIVELLNNRTHCPAMFYIY